MKNTDKNLNIKKKNIFNKKTIATGIATFSLLTLLSASNMKIQQQTQETNVIESSCNEETDYYNLKYMESLKNMDKSSFDQKFIDLYNLEEYTINGKKYDSRSIYITKQEDESVHLVNADDNYTDLLTNTKIDSKRINFCTFKSSSIFYDLYESGIITNGEFTTDQLNGKLSLWDENKNTATPELQAEHDASEAYEKKYGR